MKFNIPRIYEPMNLGEYSEALNGQRLWVWVNPPRSIMEEYFDLVVHNAPVPGPLQRMKNLMSGGDGRKDLVGWFAKIWSEDGRTPTDEDVTEFAQELSEADPALWDFLVQKSFVTIGEHREAAKKAPAKLSVE